MLQSSPSTRGSERPQVWIWSQTVDLAVFGGSAIFALAVAGLADVIAPDGALPTWAWFAFVLGLDVAHVWSTVFRTYLDPAELRKRPVLYAGLPIACYALGVGLYSLGPLTFWRVLAYVAVFHFVRQQVGWVAIYRARAGKSEPLEKWLDDAVIYGATGWPLLYWHAHLPREFAWFVDGDFIAVAGLDALVIPAGILYAALVAAYVVRSARRALRGRAEIGKDVVVVSTAAVWFLGIVATDLDFTFTVTNVTVHAVPYFALLWAYSRERAREIPKSFIARVVRIGVPAFVSVALGFAFLEELGWERLVWHDRPGWFGGPMRTEPYLSETALVFVVPLLSLPQVVHYALDGVLWRGRDAGPAQARALGFRATA